MRILYEVRLEDTRYSKYVVAGSFHQKKDAKEFAERNEKELKLAAVWYSWKCVRPILKDDVRIDIIRIKRPGL